MALGLAGMEGTGEVFQGLLPPPPALGAGALAVAVLLAILERRARPAA